MYLFQSDQVFVGKKGVYVWTNMNEHILESHTRAWKEKENNWEVRFLMKTMKFNKIFTNIHHTLLLWPINLLRIAIIIIEYRSDLSKSKYLKHIKKMVLIEIFFGNFDLQLHLIWKFLCIGRLLCILCTFFEANK